MGNGVHPDNNRTILDQVQKFEYNRRIDAFCQLYQSQERLLRWTLSQGALTISSVTPGKNKDGLSSAWQNK